MSWDPSDDEPTARRTWHPEHSGLSNHDDFQKPRPTDPDQEES